MASGWYREEKPLWPDEVEGGKVKYPWRVKLVLIKLGIVNFKELMPKLKFIENKEGSTVYLVGTPANLRRPISEEDAKLIIESHR